MTTPVRDQVREIFSTALERSVPAGENVEQTEEPAWDSVKHIELVMMLEERFGVTFEPEDFAELTSLEACVRGVEARLGGRAP